MSSHYSTRREPAGPMWWAMTGVVRWRGPWPLPNRIGWHRSPCSRLLTPELCWPRCSDQGLRSSYVGFFQLPICPEQVLLTANAAVLRRVLRRSGLSEGCTDAYVTRQQQPGALTASLAWYRAIALSGMPPGDVPVPTRFVWSSGDAALGRRAAELTGDHVSGDYDFQVVDGAPHWLPEERPELVASAILRQVGAFPLEAARTPQGRR